MDPIIKTGTGSGIQSQLGSQGSLAQPAPVGDAGGTPIGQVQPSVTGGNLGPQNGIALNDTVLPNVQLSLAPTTAASSRPAVAIVKPHHVNAALLVLPLLLVIIAAVSIWQAKRDAKSTTDYY